MDKSDSSVQTIETRTTVQTYRDDGVLQVVLKKNADVTLDDARENHDATEKLLGDRDYLVLVDIRPARSVSREARTFFADTKIRKNTLAQAFVVDSGISRVMGNFFIGLNKPDFPTRLFTSEEEAVRWLKGHAR